jgi:hypothetical protein
MAGYHKYDNYPSGSIKGGSFFGKLSDCYLEEELLHAAIK